MRASADSTLRRMPPNDIDFPTGVESGGVEIRRVGRRRDEDAFAGAVPGVFATGVRGGEELAAGDPAQGAGFGDPLGGDFEIRIRVPGAVDQLVQGGVIETFPPALKGGAALFEIPRNGLRPSVGNADLGRLCNLLRRVQL